MSHVFDVRLRGVGAGGFRAELPGDEAQPAAYRLRRLGIRSLFVGGNRESKTPGIGAFVERHVGELLAVTAAIDHG